MERLAVGQAPQVVEEALDLIVDGPILLVGADDVLALPSTNRTR